jgi:subtilisin family serine protease
MKIDVLGGDDYNNLIESSGGNVYYNRGSSPNSDGLNGFEVGAMGLNFVSGTEAKSSYSDAGPGVEIYAAGDRIISAMSEVNDDDSNVPYYLNSSFKQQRLSGTSMACPQVAGMCALLLQAHPDWNTSQVRRWMNNNAQNILYSTGLDNDYTVGTSLVGGAGRVAYMPMNGQLVFTLSEV